MRKLKINWVTKLFIPLLCLGMIFGTIVTVMSFRDISIRSGQVALKQLQDTTQTIQLTLEKDLQSYVHSIKTLKNIVEDKPYIDDQEKEVLVNGLRIMLQEYPQLYGAWAIVEPEGVAGAAFFKNTPLHDDMGRFAPYLDDLDGDIAMQTLVSHKLEGVPSDFHRIPLQTNAVYVTPAIAYKYKGVFVRVISICIPFDVGGEVRGVIGVDLEISCLTDYIAGYKVYEKGYAVLYDRDRTVIAHPDKKFLGTNPYEEHKMIPLEKSAMDQTMATYEFTAVKARAGGDGELSYKTFAPVFIHPNVDPYIVQIVVPLVEIFAPMRRLKLNILIVGIAMIITVAFFIKKLIIYNMKKLDHEINWKYYLNNK
ncbi:MAG: PDC sensor domain-containing protein [Cellulosilyticaceae bacterium]